MNFGFFYSTVAVVRLGQYALVLAGSCLFFAGMISIQRIRDGYRFRENRPEASTPFAQETIDVGRKIFQSGYQRLIIKGLLIAAVASLFVGTLCFSIYLGTR
jgi:hypothetical protein